MNSYSYQFVINFQLQGAAIAKVQALQALPDSIKPYHFTKGFTHG
jgi:hypothetical protein